MNAVDTSIAIEADSLARTSQEEQSTASPPNGKFTQWLLDHLPKDWKEAYEATMETKMEEVGPSASFKDFFVRISQKLYRDGC